MISLGFFGHLILYKLHFGSRLFFGRNFIEMKISACDFNEKFRVKVRFLDVYYFVFHIV